MKKRGGIGLSTEAMVIVTMALVGLVLGIAFTVSLDKEARNSVSVMGSEINRQQINLMLQSSRVAIPTTYAKAAGGDAVVLELGIKNELAVDADFFLGVEAPYCPECNAWIKGIDINKNLNIKRDQIAYYMVLIDIPKDIAKGQYTFRTRVCHDNPDKATEPRCHETCDDFYMDEKYREILVEVV